MKDSIKITGLWTFEITDTVTGKTRVIKRKNLIPTIGKTSFACQMAGSATKDIGDDLYIACGSNVTAPALGDTTLGTETVRKAVGSKTYATNVTSIAVFFAATEATGTHKEFGLFGDGVSTDATAAADSGILYSHVAANVTCSSVETLTITFEISFV